MDHIVTCICRHIFITLATIVVLGIGSYILELSVKFEINAALLFVMGGI